MKEGLPSVGAMDKDPEILNPEASDLDLSRRISSGYKRHKAQALGSNNL